MNVLSHPGNLIVHPSEAEINPVGDGSTRDEPDASPSNVWATFGILGAHLGLVGRNGA